MSLITVIIRTVGRPTLRRALDSVALQCDGSADETAVSVGRGGTSLPEPLHLTDIRVCLVNAAGTPQALEGVAQPEGLRLQVVGQGRPLSRAEAAQLGLDAVETPWALFLDDDDELLPGHLHKLRAALRAHPEAVAAHTGVEQCREGSPEVLNRWDSAFEPWQLLAANALPIHAVLFDVQRVRASGVRFDTAFDIFEDWDFWLQVHTLGPVVRVPGISARYWLAAQTSALNPEAQVLGAQTAAQPSPSQLAAQSAAQSVRHGQAPYTAIWRKWWTQAPPQWWAHMWRAARDEPALRERLALTEQARGQAEQARVQAEQARVQAEQARVQAEKAREQAEQAFSQAQESLRDWAAVDTARRSELAHAEAHRMSLERDLGAQREARLRSEQELDQALVAEQGARLHLQAVLGSRSWRAMAPLRWLGRQARRVLRLRHADARRNLWWRLRHRSFPRPALLASVLPDPYQRWIRDHEPRAGLTPQQAQAVWSTWATRPMLSVIMPVYNAPQPFWDEAIQSLQAQWYPHWELCIADDASSDPAIAKQLAAWAEREPRIRWVRLGKNGHISAASNAALSLARGDWVVLFDQDDLLPPKALWCVAQAIHHHPQAGIIYSDEDKVDDKGRRFGPYFKPAFDIDLLRGQNMISHLGAYRRSLVQAVGGFRIGYEGSQDHDLALRCVERLQADEVVHIPQVLYHWRVHEASTASGQGAKPYALDAGVRAVQDHLSRSGTAARVQPHPAIPHHQVVHTISPTSAPALRVLVWGGSNADVTPNTIERCLHFEEQGLTIHSVHVEPDWAEARVRLKAWAAQQESAPALLLWEPLFAQALQQSGMGLQTALAHLMERDVGAIGWAVREPQGALHDAGWVVDPQMRLQPMVRGAGRDTHGYYGQLCLAHRVSALQAAAVLVRPSSVAATERGLQLKPGQRAVWTPLLDWSGPLIGWMSSSGWARGADPFNGAFVLESMSDGRGASDPAFNPHLCAMHADHRMHLDASFDESEMRAAARGRVRVA